MALKAGYVGVLPEDAEKLGKLPGIESIGNGLSLTDGELTATGGGGSSASIAPTFDTTAAYTAGDYVYYEDTLYRFTSNHAAGDWNSEEVTAATIGADLEENTAEIAKAYKSDDTAEVTLDDVDYFPFYDSSASAKRKTLWSNIKTVLSNIFTLLSVIGTVENGTNPTRSYAIGEHFIRNGKLGTCTSPVTPSSTWTLNTNYVEGTVAESLGKKVILWTNSSPSADFAAQTIDITLDNKYAYYLINAKLAPNRDFENWFIIGNENGNAGGSNNGVFMSTYTFNGTKFIFSYRTVVWDTNFTNKLKFEGGASIDNGVSTPDDSYMIPQKVIGVIL